MKEMNFVVRNRLMTLKEISLTSIQVKDLTVKGKFLIIFTKWCLYFDKKFTLIFVPWQFEKWQTKILLFNSIANTFGQNDHSVSMRTLENGNIAAFSINIDPTFQKWERPKKKLVKGLQVHEYPFVFVHKKERVKGKIIWMI